MTHTTPIDAARFFEFIRSSEIAVVFLSVHPRHRFNRQLSRRLHAEHPDIALGAMKLRRVLASGSSVPRFLHQGLRSCHAPAAFGVLPGYYLFRGGEMLAWDAGLPVFDDVAALARSALLGAVWSGVSSDLAFIRQALQTAADQVAAERVALLFRHAVAAGSARREAPREPDVPPQDELYWAYQVLGVVPTATDREVHDAWRRRRAETHPDHAFSDPVEFERRSRLSRDINRARDIIVTHRYPGTRGATHAWAS
ncbi:MAG: J domain-containing protein [Acidobacteriota bacterium]